MDNERYVLLGRYVESLSHHTRAHTGRVMNVAVPFLQSGVEISKKGKKEFIDKNPSYGYGKSLDAINDFLYFAGVRYGNRRKPKEKKVLPQDKYELSEKVLKKISDFINWLNERRDYSPKTIYTYSFGIKQYFTYANEFNNNLARSHIAMLESKGYKPKTINLRISALERFAEFVKKHIDIKKRKITRVLCLENVPTEREYQKMLQWAKENSIKGYWIIRLLGSTGMRCGEFRQIQWKHVLEGKVYLKCKGTKFRYIYFPETVTQEAKEYVDSMQIDPEAYVFGNACGEAASQRGVAFQINKIIKGTGVAKEKGHPHAFRHFFAKMYLRKTGDVVHLAELLGHESVDTTRIYLQKSLAEHVKTVNKNVTW